MKIYFVRHGITQANIERKYNGIIDEPLNDKGRDDLVTKRDIYSDIEFDYIYCSPLIRAKESFSILFPELEVNEYRDDLVEMNFGDWSGLNYEDKFKELEDQGYTWEDVVNPPNGETYDDLFNRTTNFLEHVSKEQSQTKNILVVTHGIVISSIMKKHFMKDANMYGLAPDNGLGYIVDLDTNEVEVIKG
ncbi:MAG: histidine phosphatase family protein [Erysipelotrichales bacterium]